MSGNKVVILDGCGLPDHDLSPVLGELSEVFRRLSDRGLPFERDEIGPLFRVLWLLGEDAGHVR